MPTHIQLRPHIKFRCTIHKGLFIGPATLHRRPRPPILRGQAQRSIQSSDCRGQSNKYYALILSELLKMTG